MLGAKFYAFPMSIQYSWHPRVDLGDRRKKMPKIDTLDALDVEITSILNTL